jgi:RNA polymerase sigma-70 factor (TIGR02943 family)
MRDKKETLAQWVDSYTDDLYRWALHKTSSVELAEDLVQDTFLGAAESWRAYSGKSTSKTWLFGILKNKIADYYRKQAYNVVSAEDINLFFDEQGTWKRGRRPVSWVKDKDHPLDNKDFVLVLHTCIHELPDLMRLCLQLTYFQNQKGREISQDLGISDTNYWQIMSRGRLRLRSCLEKNWFTTNM